MNPLHPARSAGVLATLLLAAAACASPAKPDTTWAGRELGSFPYHPLVYHLDLCILAYQLYGQSLAWPFDPYYEAVDDLGLDRDACMARVHAWAKTQGAAQLRAPAGLDMVRGPGVLGGFDDNPHHDPIVFRYDRLHPWSDTVTNGSGTWTEHLTPKAITARIRDVYVGYRPTGAALGAVSLEPLPRASAGPAPDAADVLLAFEGGTGDKGDPARPASQSILGFVLVRATAGERYDVHIVFRGSRSGSAARAAWEALSDDDESGNPDWITDMGYNRLRADEGGALVSTTGEVHRGFVRSLELTAPTLFRCLEQVAVLRGGVSPESVYVTGHSLGAALAQHFTSAVLLGDRYGPGGAGAGMPAALRAWPWKQIKLITFSAPRVGDERWAAALTTSALDSELFSTALNPFDSAALGPTDPEIVSRLLDARRPAGFRVLDSRDAVTTEKLGAGGKHVGKTVYVNAGTARGLALPSPEAHEPWKLRKLMVDRLDDPRTPAIAWRYRAMEELNPERDPAEKDKLRELAKLAAALKRYYAENGIWFDHAAFDRDAALFLALCREP